jgi:hypothetical protein
MKRAVFLDRDRKLNEEHPFPSFIRSSSVAKSGA